MTKHEIKIGKFDSDDDTAVILVNGRDVGYVERIRDQKWASASSRQVISIVAGYTVNFWDERVDDSSILEARKEIRPYLLKVLGEFSDLKSVEPK